MAPDAANKILEVCWFGMERRGNVPCGAGRLWRGGPGASTGNNTNIGSGIDTFSWLREERKVWMGSAWSNYAGMERFQFVVIGYSQLLCAKWLTERTEHLILADIHVWRRAGSGHDNRLCRGPRLAPGDRSRDRDLPQHLLSAVFSPAPGAGRGCRCG